MKTAGQSHASDISAILHTSTEKTSKFLSKYCPCHPPPPSFLLSSGISTDSQGLSLLRGPYGSVRVLVSVFVCVCWRGRAAVARGVRREGGLNLTATGLISAWQVVSPPPYALPSQPQTASRTHTAAPPQSVRTRSSSSSPALPVISDHLDCMTGQLRTRQKERKGTPNEGKESGASKHAEDKASAEPVALQRHSSTGGWSFAARGKTGARLREAACAETISVSLMQKVASLSLRHLSEVR